MATKVGKAKLGEKVKKPEPKEKGENKDKEQQKGRLIQCNT